MDIFRKAIKHYGKTNQMCVAIEEMSELQKEIVKNLRGEDNIDHLSEEIADVEIMLTQLKIMFDANRSVNDWKLIKLERLEERINGKDL